MSQVRVLVLTGFGLNCDQETCYALNVAGAEVDRVHLNSLIDRERKLEDYKIFIIGGGFAWGDDHGAGVIMAMRLKHRMKDSLLGFVAGGGIVIGICNGFQVLVNLGLLPGFEPGELKREVCTDQQRLRKFPGSVGVSDGQSRFTMCAHPGNRND